MTAYQHIKATFRAVAPHSAKQFLFNGRSALSRGILRIKSRMERAAPHDQIYDNAYYADCAEEMAQSAAGIVDALQRHLNPKDAIDIGCGLGEILKRLNEVGISARGTDLSEAALKHCGSLGLTVEKIDLERKPRLDWQADLVISLEVAEHLPADCAGDYVRFLLGMAKRHIVITAAPPGQGGTDHVNEQPQSYWISKFRAAGAVHSGELTAAVRADWAQAGVEWSRARNVIVFVANTAASRSRD